MPKIYYDESNMDVCANCQERTYVDATIVADVDSEFCDVCGLPLNEDDNYGDMTAVLLNYGLSSPDIRDLMRAITKVIVTFEEVDPDAVPGEFLEAVQNLRNLW